VMRLSEKWEKYARIIGWPAWLVLLITLPVTSSPIIAYFSGGETPVSPLSLIPLLLIILVWLLPNFIRGRSLPAVSWPILGFFLISIATGLFSIRLPILPFKDVTQLDRGIRALITLGIGISFFLSSVVLPSNEKRLIISIRALYVGFGLLLIWSTIQAVIVLDNSERMPLVITRIHHLFSVRDPISDRVTGMAFEPSWLGDQLVVLYIPLLLGSVVSGWSVFRSSAKWISIELFLLILAGFMLVLTRSRISMFSLILVGVVAYFYLGLKALKAQIQKEFLSSFQMRVPSRLVYFLGGLLLIAVMLGVALGSGWLISRFEPRLDQLFSAPGRYREFEYMYPNEAHFEVADNLAFAERLVYWSFGFKTFSQHPLMGVGPGNAGFFFETNIPPYGYQLTEIQNVLTLEDYGFTNPKNLWLRILSETGIIGFSFYFVWYMLMGFTAFLLWKKGEKVHKAIGLAGIVAFITQSIEGFSLDSYALPQVWVIFGLVVASATQSRVFGGKDDPKA
jgi:O-antigen ligase